MTAVYEDMKSGKAVLTSWARGRHGAFVGAYPRSRGGSGLGASDRQASCWTPSGRTHKFRSSASQCFQLPEHPAHSRARSDVATLP